MVTRILFVLAAAAFVGIWSLALLGWIAFAAAFPETGAMWGW
jgi:hypothetical protein